MFRALLTMSQVSTQNTDKTSIWIPEFDRYAPHRLVRSSPQKERPNPARNCRPQTWATQESLFTPQTHHERRRRKVTHQHLEGLTKVVRLAKENFRTHSYSHPQLSPARPPDLPRLRTPPNTLSSPHSTPPVPPSTPTDPDSN